jgi:transposase
MAEPTSCCVEPGGYCARVDTLFNLPGVHVLKVAWHEAVGRLPAGLRLVVETSPTEAGCPGCGVVAEPRGRRLRRLHDIPAFGAPVQLVWRQRRYRCREAGVPGARVHRGPWLGGAAGQADRPGGVMGDRVHPT